MKLRTVDGETVTVLLKELRGRPARMLLDVETEGGRRIAKGARVLLSEGHRYLRVWTEPCPHCGTSFAVRLSAAQALYTVALLDAQDQPREAP